MKQTSLRKRGADSQILGKGEVAKRYADLIT